jgi:transposase
MINANVISNDTKTTVAIEVLSSEKTKSQIAKEFGISVRSVGRWADKFKNEAQEILSKKEENVVSTSINKKEEKILADYYENKHYDMINVDRRFKRGVPKKGTKSIRHMVLEIVEARKDKNELTKANRSVIIQEISDTIGHEYKRCIWYFSVYKKVLGGYQG